MTAIRLTSSGLDVSGHGPLAGGVALLDSILRGVGQVMFQNNSYSGLLFLLGIAWNSPLFALGAFVGTVASTLSAMALGAERALVRSGMFGFNGGLVGVALLYFLEPGAFTWACVIAAAACSAIVMAALLAAFDRIKLPALTAPFVFTSLCFFLASARLGRLDPSGLLPAASLPQAVAVEGVVTAATVAQGLLNGVAQVFFQGNVVTGALFLAGLLVASRIACGAALAGSGAGLVVAWAMGAAEPALRDGTFGFNSVLVAIALAGVFIAPGRLATAYALLAAGATTIVAAATTAALAPLGMPALTLPFVLVTWICVLASQAFTRLRAAPVVDE